MAVIEEVTSAYEKARTDQTFLDELDRLQTHYAGRPSPSLYEAERLSQRAGGADLPQARGPQPHRVAKINNVLGQALLAKQMGKTRVIAETGSGPARRGYRHRLRALLGLECIVYMGAVDTARQALNVARMRASRRGSRCGAVGFEDAEGRRQRGVRDCGPRGQHVPLLRHAAGPHPFPGDGPRRSG